MTLADLIIFGMFMLAALSCFITAVGERSFGSKFGWLLAGIASAIVAGAYVNIVWQGN